LTVSNTASFSGPYSPNGSTSAFPFGFKVIDHTEVVVFQGASQVTSGFSVSLNDSGDGGTVNFDSAPSAGSGSILVASDPDFLQDLQWENNGAFLPTTFTEGFDRADIRAIWLKAGVNRSIRAPIGEVLRQLPGPDERALKILAFDSLGQPVVAWLDDVVTEPAPAATPSNHSIFYVDDFGAVGDSNGTTGSGHDNLAAFQAAIAAAKAAGGGRVVVTAGTFRLPTAALVVDRSNIGLELIGNMFFDSADNTTFGRLIFDGTGAPGGRIKNNYVRGSGAVFNRAGIAVSGPNPGYNGCACLITFRNCDWFECVGPELYQSPNYGVSILNSTDGRITVHAHDQVADGVHVQDGSKRVTVANCVIHNVGDDGIGLGFWGNPIEDCKAIGNSIHDVGGRGIACFAPSSGSRVIGNAIRNTWGPGLLIEANNFTVANKWTKDVGLIGNSIDSAGMFSGFSRSQDLACGIFVNTVGGLIDNVLIQGNTVRGSRNGHLWTLGPATGHISSLTISGNTFDTIAAHGGQGAAPSGGGQSINPSDGDFSGVKVMQAEVLHLANNTLVDSYHDGFLVGAGVMEAHVYSNSAANVGTGNAGRKYGFSLQAMNTVERGNAMSLSPLAYGTKDVAFPWDGSFRAVPGTVIASDTFNRANAGPSVGALGSTPVGGKAWTGSSAGVSSNQALFAAGSYPAVAIDAGTSNVDISCDVTLNGYSARLIARTTSAPATGSSLVFDLTGFLFSYDGSVVNNIGFFDQITTGTHTLRMIVKGDNVACFVDGLHVASARRAALQSDPAYGKNTYVGFQDDSPNGSARFDNFSVSTVAMNEGNQVDLDPMIPQVSTASTAWQGWFSSERVMASYAGPIYNATRMLGDGTSRVGIGEIQTIKNSQGVEILRVGTAFNQVAGGSCGHAVQTDVAKMVGINDALPSDGHFPFLFDGKRSTINNGHPVGFDIVANLDGRNNTRFYVLEPRSSVTCQAWERLNGGVARNLYTSSGFGPPYAPDGSGKIQYGDSGAAVPFAFLPSNKVVVAIRDKAGGSDIFVNGVKTASATVLAAGTITQIQVGYQLVSGLSNFWVNMPIHALGYASGQLSDYDIQETTWALAQHFGVNLDTTRPRIVISGDSIMESVAMSQCRTWPSLFQNALSRPVELFNLGIAGKRLSECYSQRTTLENGLYSGSRRCVAVLQGGVNDIHAYGDTGANLYSATTTPYVAYLKGLGYKVVVCTLLPETASNPATANPQLVAYNALVRANGATADYVWDVAAEYRMGIYPTSPDNPALYPDKIHPSDLGGMYLASTAAAKLNLAIA
jgi:hypothetical protein